MNANEPEWVKFDPSLFYSAPFSAFSTPKLRKVYYERYSLLCFVRTLSFIHMPLFFAEHSTILISEIKLLFRSETHQFDVIFHLEFEFCPPKIERYTLYWFSTKS